MARRLRAAVRRPRMSRRPTTALGDDATLPAGRDPETLRLGEDARRQKNWKRWGPYLAERAWGTVREDYSADGSAWTYFPHDHARSRAFRWGEDGIAGLCDRHQFVCLALALWNGRDPILKERLFGLSGPEGNHGEDVKEYYYYLDSSPTHSYMKCLYKYPQRVFPYAWLVGENARRGRDAPEFELVDTGIFDDDRYFDVFTEYAKASPDDVLVRFTVFNRGPATERLHLLPTIWYRNTWSWGLGDRRQRLWAGEEAAGRRAIELDSAYYGRLFLAVEGEPELLFTENETNFERLFGVPNPSAHVKDSFHRHLVNGAKDAVNPARRGSKATALFRLDLPPGGSASVRLRLSAAPPPEPFGGEFDETFTRRIAETDAFYAPFASPEVTADGWNVQRQAAAGMLWTKQYYHYDVGRWLKGDPGDPPPPPERWQGRNQQWQHLYNADVLSMPDKWEYPWYAAWDLAFHCVTLAIIDPDFAKQQLVLLLREWYMHPNGQLPAYEWAFSDVNPPLHAWAAWRVFKIDRKRRGVADRAFLERVFHKLLLNFTWWVNRKDAAGNNVFQGGFLGLDNIGVFDRSAPLPTGGTIQQSDGTSWMGMYCLNMLAMALQLADEDPAYEDVASKFFEHFVYICRAMNDIGGSGIELWNPQDGFFYDVLQLPDGRQFPLKVRSMVGLIPLFAVETMESEVVDRFPGFKRRMQWFLENRPELSDYIETQSVAGNRVRRLLALVNRTRLASVLRYMLDENEFLSPHGVRALSRYHKEHPYTLGFEGHQYRVDYEPAESRTGTFGGNSNWRGPVWFPVNYLIIESLQKYHYFLGDGFRIEFPTGSGNKFHLWDIAAKLSRRLSRIFLRDASGRRPVYGGIEKFQTDPHFRDLVLFYEYFHGDTGFGLGASHQTGWTGLVAKLIQQSGD
jgi:Mannosylglycerate hydrolase MGH1-like glycoside hydrolase domain